MSKRFRYIVMALMTMLMVGLTMKLPVKATETGPEITWKVNEPLDNAVPVIYSYEIVGAEYITPGEQFTLNFKVYNPAVASKIGNIRIVVTQDHFLLSPLYKGTNSVYIGYLEPLSYTEGSITLVASKEINSEELPIVINMTFTDNYSTLNQQQLAATLPVSSSGKLNISRVDIPSTMYVGSNNRLSISYENSGLSTINDVVLHMSGDTLDDQEIQLGTVGSGLSKTSDVYISFKQNGAQTIHMYCTYSDTTGAEHETEVTDYSLDVKSYDELAVSEYDQININRNMNNRYVTYGVLGVSVVTLIVCAVAYLKKKKADKKIVKENKV